MASPVTPETLPLSVDLEEQARYHIAFLAKVESLPELKQHAVLWRALYRYEKFWLPLAADHSHECLSAPLDIEWIWHCHLLAPRTYAKDCIVTVSTVVNHKLRSQTDYNEAVEKSRTYWLQKYGERDGTRFSVEYETPLLPTVPEDFKPGIAYKVIEAAGRQKVFYYQVSLPHYRDRKYLKGSLLRYRKFLFLKTKFPQSFSIPCFEMDLMWHTHLLNPLLYREDTIAILGNVFNHDDTVNDRSEGSRLNNAQDETTKQWVELFNESYSLPGAMYRGQPPGGVLYRLSENETNMVSTKTTEITLNSLKLKLPQNATVKSYGDVRVNAHGCAGSRFVTKLFSLKKRKYSKDKMKDQNKNDREIEFETNREAFIFKTRAMNSIRIDVETKTKKLACVGTVEKYESHTAFDLLSKVENSDQNSGRAFQITQYLSDGACVDANCSYSDPVRESALLFLQTGTEESAVIPANVQAFLGPVNIERIHSGADNRCLVTTIRMKNHVGKTDFSSKVVFSQSMMLSVIQIFYRDLMVVVAHPIGCDQLPAPSQVDDDVITLDHQLGERAILIKNHGGDWGILKGRVTGETGQNANNGTLGKDAVGESGNISLYLYKMSTGTVEETVLGPSKAGFRLDSTRVDLSKGVIEIDTDSLEVGERIALAFSVSLLQKMLVPKKRQ